MTMHARLLFLIPYIALAACGSEIVQAHMYRSGVIESFRYAARDGDVHVVILNNPFAADRATVEGSITGAMTGHNAAQVQRFVPVPEGAAPPPSRIVMLFNPPVSMTGIDLCEGSRADGARTAGDRLRLLASFCLGNQAQSQAIASTPALASPADLRFKALIQQTMLNLIPIQEPCASNNCEFNDD